MDIKKFNVPINQLIYALFITSGLPGITYHSIFFESFNPLLKFNLYIGSLFLREFFTFLLGIKITLILIKKLNSLNFKYRTLFAFLPLSSIILLVLFDYNVVLLATGIRFYILFSLPLMVFEDQENLNFRRNITINDFIVYVYLVLNIISLIIGHADFEQSGYTDTFLGVRYPFIFDNPVIAAQQFGVFLLYLNFRLIISKRFFEKTTFLITSFIVLFLTLYTGGRAGLVVAMLVTISTTIIYFFPKIKYIFLTPKKVENKLITIGTLFAFALVALLISSNPLISGRQKTMIQYREKGIYGVGESRYGIMTEFLNEGRLEDIIFGKPGKGTNTACNRVINDYDTDECKKTDSAITSSLVSFGIVGILFYSVTLLTIMNASYSPLVAITFIVYSFAQIFPELILPWTQFVLLLFHSNQYKIYKLKILSK